MNIDPQQIRAEVQGILAALPAIATDADDRATGDPDIEAIEAVGRQLEQAHQILVDALESVEKG